jgi:hypothetical protein
LNACLFRNAYILSAKAQFISSKRMVKIPGKGKDCSEGLFNCKEGVGAAFGYAHSYSLYGKMRAICDPCYLLKKKIITRMFCLFIRSWFF